MPTRVRFRINKVSGDVEEFLVDDQDRTLPEAEHDRIASEVGRVIARRPTVTPFDLTLAQPMPAVQGEGGTADSDTDTATPTQQPQANTP